MGDLMGEEKQLFCGTMGVYRVVVSIQALTTFL